MSEVKNYSADLQKLFVQFMMTDPQLFTRIMGIVDDRHFDREVREVVKYIISYSNEYQSMPSSDSGDKFVCDFISAWNKVMNADRFDIQ